MKKYLLLSFLGIIATICPAQEAYRGIEFHHGDWQSAMQRASDENKLIFIDFMTEWCGPCHSMAEEVFPQAFVGEFYNSHFVCVKIDAEKGEGIELAKRYRVRVFPTFVFVNPADGEPVHRSTSRQSADTFLFTGRSATDPLRRSPYLEKRYEDGDTSKELLVNYIDYQASMFNRDGVREAFGRLMANGGNLSDPETWRIFDQNITGADNPWLEELSTNYDSWTAALGKETVDRKLARETRNLPAGRYASLPDFKGKRLNMLMGELDGLIRSKNHTAAADLVRDMMRDGAIDQQALINDLRYALRNSYWQDDTPMGWLRDCAEFMRYIAYNYADREEASIHFDYAQLLERLIGLSPAAAEALPASIAAEPEVGQKEYSMRPPTLAKKPARR